MATDGPRIVISGAGGWVFPLELSRDILSFQALAGSTLVLYDVDPAAAQRTHGFVRQMIDDAKLPTRLEVAPDLRSSGASRRTPTTS
jgi:alpha-galactosidase/6-phospho-beta-glucosidase family protein